ncbi:MAG: glycosyl hydrolase [Rikenellaceae bacterium]
MNKNIYLLLAVGGVLVATTSCTDEEPNAPVSDLISYGTGADATFTDAELQFPAKRGIKKTTSADTYDVEFVDEFTAYNVMWYNTGSSKYYLDFQPTYYEAGVDELVDEDGNITQAGVEEVFVNSEFVPQPSAITNASNGALEAFVAGIESCVVDGTVSRVLGMPIKGTTATAAEVAAVWPALEYLEVPLTSPVADLAVASEVAWLAEFMALVSSKGLRVDYVGASYYGSYTSLDTFKTAVAALNTSYNLPVVLSAVTATDVYAGDVTLATFMAGVTSYMQESISWLDAQSYVYAYAWDVDMVDPNLDLYDDTTSTFTTIGEAFMDISYVPVYAVQPDASTLPATSSATGYEYAFNKLSNDGFEDGTDFWTLDNASVISVDQSAVLGVGLDMYLFDNNMLYMGDGDGSATQTFTLSADKYDQYTFGFVGRVQDKDGRGATDGTKLYMVVTAADGTEIYNGSTSTDAVTTNSTSLFNALGTFKATTASTTISVKIVKEGGASTNQAFVDNVFISCAGSALLGENLFVNGDIEAGAHDSNAVKNVQGIVTRSDTNGYLFCDDGSYMLYLGNTSNNYANFGYKGIAVEDGAKYRMSADVRLTSDLTSVPGASDELDGITPTGTDYYSESETPTGDGYFYFQMKKGSNNGVVHYSGGAYYQLGGTYVAPAGSSDETYYTVKMAKENGGGFHNLVWDYVVDYSTLGGYTTVSPFVLIAKVKAEALFAHVDNVKFQKVYTEAEADAIIGW